MHIKFFVSLSVVDCFLHIICFIIFCCIPILYPYILNPSSFPDKKTCRDKVRALQTKMAARNERLKLLLQRGSPDSEPLDT